MNHMNIWYLYIYIYLYDYHVIPEDVLCDMDLMFQDVSWPGAKKMTHSIWWHLNRPHVTPVTPWINISWLSPCLLCLSDVWSSHKLTKLDMKYGAQHNHTHISNLQNACIAPTKWGFLAHNSAVLYSVVTFETCSEIAPVPLGALLDGQIDCWLFKRYDFPLSLCDALCQFMNSRQAFTQKQLSDSCRCHLFSVSCGLEIFRNLPKMNCLINQPWPQELAIFCVLLAAMMLRNLDNGKKMNTT